MTQEIDYGRHYKKWHADTPEHIQAMKDFYKRRLSGFLPSDKNIHILDIGCGMGFTMIALQSMGYTNVEGIDIDPKQVQSCIDKQLRVTLVDNSIEHLSKKPNIYDLVLCFDLIEHIPYGEQLDFAKAVQTTLKPGGKLIWTAPNANSVLASHWRYDDWTHHISFTEHSLDFLLFNAGFMDIQIFETEFFQAPKLSNLFSRSILKKCFWRQLLHWELFRFVRFLRRIEMIAELGWEQGRTKALSLNFLATAVKPL